MKKLWIALAFINFIKFNYSNNIQNTKIIEWNSHINLDEEILFLVFTKEWCHYCKILMPIIDELDKILPTQIKICTIDCEKYPEMADKFQIKTVPSMFLVKKGHITKYSGERNATVINNWLKKNIE